MTISLCTLLTIIMIFSTFLRFLRLPIRSRVRRPKLWVSTGFKSSSQECQNMNCVASRKLWRHFFIHFYSSRSWMLHSWLFISIHQSLGPWEDRKFWDWPRAKKSLVWRQCGQISSAFFSGGKHYRPPSAQVSGASAQDPNFSVVDVLFVSLLSKAGQSYMRNGL